jgi:hypothetical protein
MGPKRTIVVVILALLGSALSWYTHRRDADASPAPGRRGLLLSPEALPVDQVDRITLRRSGEPALELARDGVTWRQEAPLPHPMDPFSIRQLAVLATSLEVTDALDPGRAETGTTLQDLGLDPPLAVLEYRWPDGELTLRLGHPGIAGRAYLQVGDEPTVHVVDRSLHDRAVEMDPREWRDRRLFLHAGIDSARIEMIEGERYTTLIRQRRQWTMEQPVRTRVDPAARDELLQALGRAECGGFILDHPADLDRFGLAPPAGSLTVTGAVPREVDGQVVREERTERLLIGARIGGGQDRFGLVEGRPTVVRLGAAALAALFRAPARLADPTPSGVVAADVKSLVIRTGDAELRLERRLERWVAPDHGDAEVQTTLALELLHQLTDLRAADVQLRTFPRDLQVATVTLHGYDGRPMDTVRIARDPQDDRWAMDDGDDVLRVYPSGLGLRLTAEEYGLE